MKKVHICVGDQAKMEKSKAFIIETCDKAVSFGKKTKASSIFQLKSLIRIYLALIRRGAWYTMFQATGLDKQSKKKFTTWIVYFW